MSSGRGAWAVFLAVSLIGAALPAAAGESDAGQPAPPTFAHGTRVRVELAGRGRLVAYVAEVREDVLVVDRRVDGVLERLELKRGELRKLEISERPSQRGRGAVIGLAVGAAGGIALGLIGGDSSCPDDPGPATWENFSQKLGSSTCIGKGAGAALGAFALGGIGAALGAAVAPGEKWRAVDTRTLHVRLTGARGGGAGLQVSLRF